MTIDGFELEIEQLVASATVVVVAVIIWFLFKRYRQYYLKKAGKTSGIEAPNFGYGIIRAIIIVIAILTILQINGINITSAITGLGIASAIVGLALQDFIKDVINGVTIVTNKYFKVGDALLYDGKIGVVKRFSLRFTEIEDIDNHSRIIIRNGVLTTIVKVSDQVDIDIGLSYEEDPKVVHETLNEICNKIKELKNVYSCRYKGTQDFKESSIIYRIRFFCPVELRPDTRRAAITLIQDGLNEKGITIPFNQLDIHVKELNK